MAMQQFTGERFVPGKTSRRIADDHTARYAFAASFVKARRILDIACGTGYGSVMSIAAGAASVDGVDICADTIELAKRRYTHPRLRFHVGDIAKFSSPVPYDVVLCFETIEHVTDPAAALRNLRALLQPRGTLLISSPNRVLTSPGARSCLDKPRNRFHVHEYSQNELLALLLEHGFEMAPDALFGQRQQRTIENRAWRSVFTKILATKWTASAQVLPVTMKTPRYFVVKACSPE